MGNPLLHRADVPGYLLAGVGLLCMTVLAAIGAHIPEALPVISGAGVAGGVALPPARTTPTTTQRGR